MRLEKTCKIFQKGLEKLRDLREDDFVWPGPEDDRKEPENEKPLDSSKPFKDFSTLPPRHQNPTVPQSFYEQKADTFYKINYKTQPWLQNSLRVCWEFQFSKDHANALALELVKSDCIGMLFFKILNNYVRLIEVTDKNRSRCPMLPVWAAFAACIDSLSLCCLSVEKTLDDKRNWIISQVLPTLTGIIIADGGTLDIITQYWDVSVDRMSQSMQSLVDRALSSASD